MDTMKKFIKYAIWLVIGFLLVNILSVAFIAKTYKEFYNYQILTNTPVIEITESRNTRVNGYVVAAVTNNTSAVINNKYIRLNFYDKANNYIGSEFVEMSNFHPNKTSNFIVHYKYSEVEKYTIDVTDAMVEKEKNVNTLINTQFEKFVALVSFGLVLYWLLP